MTCPPTSTRTKSPTPTSSPKTAAGAPHPAILIGHALGNRVVRAAASAHPALVSRLILLASGGQAPIPPVAAKALVDVFDTSLSPADHIAAVRTAFFSPGNDPEVWRDGWYPAAAVAQQRAVIATPPGDWNNAGTAPIFIIQAADDEIAPPAFAEALQKASPSRVTIAVVAHAGHAMLPEQPAKLARLITDDLRKIPY